VKSSLTELNVSPPILSTIRIGSHQFRNHFGYYLERAAAGVGVEIARHGRPYARLVPCAQRG
jgi:prevent-host-death family protein